ncbi:uncharacterized protein LOC119613936 [Lucilia sericata]|uniref:uncharacterized protein LOC119613936 n=1 Tax=Lucilia sericata TaxID=13632 RepID=UPI0018A7EA29|nr:uncharacterized protein LOC119613936 [Lucilia sericata]
MDEEHAEEVSKKIKENAAKDEYLLNIVRNLSSAQDMTMEIIRKQNKAVFKDITKLSGAIQVLEGEIHETKDEATRVAAIANILSSLEVLERIQNDIIGAIFNAKGNFLNGILPIRKFKKQIELIKVNLNKNLRLPTEDPVELAKVSKVFTRTTEDFVLFSIQLPLINHEIFDAYEVYQYPITHDGYSVNIHTNSRYFLIDKRKALSYILDDGNFEHCQKMRDLTLCHQVHPLFSTRSVNSCEVKLFLRAKQIPDSCEIEIKNLQNYWRQTYTPNTWIFSVYEHTPAEVTCQDKTQHIVLHGSGLLTMEADCHLEAADLHLWAYDTYATDVHYVFPSMNITSFMPNISHLKLNSEVEVYKILDIPKETTILGFPILAEGHHLNHYKISLIIITVVIIALFWILKRTCHISSTSLPATITLPRII